MQDSSVTQEFILEVVSPDRSRQVVSMDASPFLIGRGETGNHLALADSRISRQCAAIVLESGTCILEDRGHRRGIFVNGIRIDRRVLAEGDVISFGVPDSYQIVFRLSKTDTDTSVQNILDRIESISHGYSPGGLAKINLLLEATMLLHSQLPLDTVLATMVDHAISITGADRGLLIETDSSGSLHTRLAQNKGGLRLPVESFTPSQTALREAIRQQSSVIAEDVTQAYPSLQDAESIVAQSLRAIIAIPLYAVTRAVSTHASTEIKRGQFLGVLYLDSQQPAAFSRLDRQILDAIAAEAASILDNARLVERERGRQRLEQELAIAREIQSALIPTGFREFQYLTVNGTNSPCLAVGGDYFDVFPLSDERTGFLIADVSGKGLGAALLTTMLQGALSSMTMGARPAHAFSHINRFLCEHAEVGRYATVFFGTLDQNGLLEFINAGHPSPLLLRSGKVSEPFTEGSLPVGLIPNTDYTTAEVQLETGDTLVLFSDGVTEAVNPDGEMFGVSRLIDSLIGHHLLPLDNLLKIVLQCVESFADGASQADDITVMLVRYLGPVQGAVS